MPMRRMKSAHVLRRKVYVLCLVNDGKNKWNPYETNSEFWNPKKNIVERRMAFRYVLVGVPKVAVHYMRIKHKTYIRPGWTNDQKKNKTWSTAGAFIMHDAIDSTPLEINIHARSLVSTNALQTYYKMLTTRFIETKDLAWIWMHIPKSQNEKM